MERVFDYAELCRSDAPMRSFRDARQSVILHAAIRAGEGTLPARVRNISPGGVMAECAFRGPPGQRVAVSLRGLGDVAGAVAWIGDDRIGVCFDAPIDPAIPMQRPPTPDMPQIIRAPRLQRSWRPGLVPF